MGTKISLAICLVTLAACAQSLPPGELVDARAAYKAAAAGPAAQLDPAALHVAEEQLRVAENSFDKTGDSPETRANAYSAERRAELAASLAHTLDANARINLATQNAELTQARVLQSTRSQLAESRQQLAAATAAMAELASVKSVNVKQESRGTVITVSGSVLFASNKYDLLPSAQETLSHVAEALSKSDPSSKIVVQGYTDSQGPVDYNEILSQHRADSVRAFLTARGIPSERISAEGFGPANPVASNESADGRANNRRVEIVVAPPPAEPPPPTSTQTTTTAIVH